MIKRHTLGFALGSGGSRGIAHIGFLKAMEEGGIVPDYIAGCSMGSVVGGAYAAGMSIDEIWSIVSKLTPGQLIEPCLKRGGLFNSDKIVRLLTKYLGGVQFSDLKIPFRCVAVDVQTQEVVCLKEGPLVNAIVASSCIPAIFNPIQVGDRTMIDGGVLERVPVAQLKEMGPEKIVAVDVLGHQDMIKKTPTMLSVMLHVVGINDNHRTAERRHQYRSSINLWIEPELGDMNQYAFKNFQFAYDQGYKAGCENVKKIRSLISRK